MLNKNKLPLHTMYPSSDPFIQKIRQMCTRDKVVQSLYQRTISWSDVPSDDDMLELDDWKSYEKIAARAKDAYKIHVTSQKKVYTNPQRSKTKKHCNQIVVTSRIPYATLKQSRSIPETIVTKKLENQDVMVYQTPVKYEEPMDSVLPPSELAPVTLLDATCVAAELVATVVTEELVSHEIVPTKIVEVNNIPFTFPLSSFYRYVFLSVIILVYTVIMNK